MCALEQEQSCICQEQWLMKPLSKKQAAAVDELLSVGGVADSDATSERGLSLSIAHYNHEEKCVGGSGRATH